MFYELSLNFKSFQSGNNTHKVHFYVGHDGSMIRLAAGLGLGKDQPLRWPAMGSEFVLEVSLVLHKKTECLIYLQVWRTKSDGDFVRGLHEGTPIPHLQWMPLSEFIRLLDAQVPENLYQTCMATS